ncbi:PREDICTED: elongation of very long chain fatty acids protein 1-like isoform X1 [Ceratosolen solmsi marchali]|uniref:Elongation of very long chain fatty acids protein n=2 Tax=Ceratosolen solmsi marchali TaxID=326594 RepID=A0AAJ7E1J1_9HYME|nr:PREDICTED: elongation of very long chain fatty acids protein 1-like isoform X1 [Ceratosolen solmsi marchali]
MHRAHTRGAAHQEARVREGRGDGQSANSVGGRLPWQDMGPVEAYRYLVEEISDPRVADWPMMASPFPVSLILLAYLLFVLHLGPRYMQHRSPYDLYNFMVGYNIAVAICSATVFYGLLTSGFTTNLSWGCEPVDYSLNPEAIRMASWVWWIMLLKITELGDTVIFVLRKKYNQCSFLHIYHHVTTVSLAWIACKYAPGGMWTFIMMPNCLVHVIMYSYYLLACLGPRMQKKLSPWKPYLTMLQLIQFVIMVIHTSQALLPSCEPKLKPLAFIYMSNVIVIFYMFWDFYKKAYLSKKTV